MIKLSKRLQCVANMVSTGNGIVDVGTDHAYIPIYMIQQRIKSYAYAADVNKGPLVIAKNHINEMGLSDSITTCLSDGLQKTEVKENDSITIAGMGGLLVKKIIEQDMDKAKRAKELILQPQSEIMEVRLFLQNNEFEIVDEDAVIDDEKFYFVIKAVPANDTKSYSKEELAFGPVLLKKQNPVLLEYLQKQIGICDKIKSELNKQTRSEAVESRLISVEEESALMKNVLRDYYEM